MPLEPSAVRRDASRDNYWIFAVMIGFVIVVGGVVLARNRWGGGV